MAAASWLKTLQTKSFEEVDEGECWHNNRRLNLVYLAFSIFPTGGNEQWQASVPILFFDIFPGVGALLNNLPWYFCSPLLAVCLFIKKTNRIEGETVLIWWIRFELTFNRVYIFWLLLDDKGNLFDKPAMIRDVNVLEEVLCLRF